MDEMHPWDRQSIDDIEEDDEPAARPVWLRVTLMAFAVVAIVALLAVPALQLGVWLRADSPSPEDRLRQNTAVIFTAALLQRRSARLAMRVADPDVRSSVDAIVRVVEARDPSDLDDARVTLTGTHCAGLPEGSQACYEATLHSQSGLEIIQFRFSVTLAGDGSAIVTGVLPSFRSI